MQHREIKSKRCHYCESKALYLCIYCQNYFCERCLKLIQNKSLNTQKEKNVLIYINGREGQTFPLFININYKVLKPDEELRKEYYANSKKPEQYFICSNDSIFPPSINKFYYTNNFDLKLTAKYASFANAINNSDASNNFNIYNAESNMSNYVLKHLQRYESSTIIVDMTGNIGCDTANFAFTLPNQFIFTCEIEKSKVYCLKGNLKSLKNNYIFWGDSTKLLKAVLNKDTKIIKSMLSRTSRNKKLKLLNIINELEKYKIIVLIDPPFGSDYRKYSDSTKLEFCGSDILDYLYEFNKIAESKILKYIIKCPRNWDRLKEINEKLKSFDNEYIKLIFSPTSKNGLYYAILEPKFFELLFRS